MLLEAVMPERVNERLSFLGAQVGFAGQSPDNLRLVKLQSTAREVRCRVEGELLERPSGAQPHRCKLFVDANSHSIGVQ